MAGEVLLFVRSSIFKITVSIIFWFFSGDLDVITVNRKKLNLLKAPLYGKMNQIDIGISLLHLWLSLDHQGKVVSFDFEKDSAPSGYEFMTKVKIGSN